MLYIRKETIIGFLVSFLFTSAALANPVLGNVASGNVSISQTPNTTTINQSSQQAILNWQSFNIGAQQATHFIQPAGGIALNRISPTQGASQIYGVLTATGQIILINPAGIYFGPGSYVNVGGMIATTSNISNKNFLSGNYSFDQGTPYANAQIINAGTLIAAKNGMIALVGPNVTNNGMIRANLGKVVLASGNAFTVDFSGNGMVNFAVSPTSSSHSGSVTNTGSLIADGGQVLISAQQASGVLDNVINLKGIVEAKSVYKQNGEIIISGDPNGGVVNVAANINASGTGKGQTGGKVNITGYNILLDSPTLINVSGNAGGGTINVGGNLHGTGPLPNANAVVMAPGASLLANAINHGNGGQVVVWSNNYTNVMGSILAMGGSFSGNGGFVETSSHDLLNANGVIVNTSAANGHQGTWLLDPANVTISTGADANYTDVSNVFEPNSGAATATVNTTTLDSDLASNNIEITTTNNGVDGGNAGTITILNPISWTGGNSLTLTAASTIDINAGITIGTTSAAQLILNTPSTVAQTAAIGGAGGLVMEGGGTFTASQTNTYTGGTTITNGTIAVTTADGVGPSGNIALTPSAGNTAELDLTLSGGSLTNTTGILSLDSSAAGSTAQVDTRQFILPNPVVLTGTTNNFDIVANTFNETGGFTGTGDLILNGTGVFGMDNANSTYSGTTTLESGSKLSAFANNVLSPNSPLTGTGGNLDSFQHNETVPYFSGNFTVNSFGGVITIANAINGFSATYTGAIGSGGNVGIAINLTGTGSPVQIFTGSNTYTGTTTIDAGTLQAGATNTFSANSAVTLANVAGASLDLNNFDNTVASLAGGGSTGGNVTLGSGNLTIGGGNTTNYAGVISGTGGVTLTGGGTQTFSGTNLYSGATTIDAGTLVATTSGAIPTTSTAIAITPSAGNIAILDLTALSSFSNTNNITMDSSAAGSQAEIDTTAAITLSNAISLTGATNVFNVSASTTTLSGLISGNDGLIKQGDGILSLSNNNSYLGTTTIEAGTIAALNSGALGSAAGGDIFITPDAVSTAILDLTAISSLTNTGGVINLDSSAGGTAEVDTTAAITLPNSVSITGSNNLFNVSANTTVLGGVISGTGDLTSLGAGTLNLAAVNTYQGATNIEAGTLQQGISNAVPSTSDVTVTGTFDLNGLNDTIGSLAGSGNVISALSTLATADNNSTTFSGVISGTGFSLFKDGTGTLILSGANNYTGGTQVNGGVLQAGADNAFSPNSDVTLANTAGVALDLNNFSETISSLSGGGAVGGNVTLGTGSLTIANNNPGSNTSFGGVISSAVNDLTSLTINLTGAGSVQALTGNNTYAGATIIDAGTLQAGATNAFAPNSLVILANTAGATLDLNGFDNTVDFLAGGGANGGNVLLGSGTLSIVDALGGFVTYSGVISGTGGVTLNLAFGFSTEVFAGANTYTGTTTLNQGTFRVTNSGGLGPVGGGNIVIAPTAGTTAQLDLDFINSLTNTNGTLSLDSSAVGSTALVNTAVLFNLPNSVTLTGNNNVFDVLNGTTTLAGAITGNGGFTKQGAGILSLTNTNSYLGTTTITNGDLIAGVSGALGSGDIDITPTAAATAQIDFTALNSLTNTTGAINLDSSAAGSKAQVNTSAAITLSNAIGLTGSTNVFNVSANTTSLSGPITGTGDLTKAGSGTLNLSGNNTYQGTTTINTGTVIAANANALGSTVAGTIVNSGADLTIAGVNVGAESVTLNNATLSGTGTASLAGAITLGDNSNDIINTSGTFTLSGGINGNTAGNAGLTQQGAGTLVLSGGIGSGNALASFVTNTALNLAGSTTIDATTITLNSGVNGGGNDLALNGSTIDLSGAVTLNNLTVTGTGASNTFSLNTANTQNWSVTGSDAGSVVTSGISGSGTFSNIQNIAGGSADNTFALNGGTLSGNINAGSGSNSFTGDNVATVWNITGPNTFSVTGVGSVSGISNLIGGNANNQFIFADNASFSGTINGGNLANTNTLDYSAYTTPVSVLLSSNQYNGSVVNNGSTITNYSNINNLVGNGQAQSLLVPTSAQLARAVKTGPMAGFIGDPLFWSGFNVIFPGTAPTSSALPPAVYPIIQQPETNADDNSAVYYLLLTSLGQNFDSLEAQVEQQIDASLQDIGIDPYCGQFE